MNRIKQIINAYDTSQTIFREKSDKISKYSIWRHPSLGELTQAGSKSKCVNSAKKNSSLGNFCCSLTHAKSLFLKTLFFMSNYINS